MKIIILAMGALVAAFAVFGYILAQYVDPPHDDEDEWPD